MRPKNIVLLHGWGASTEKLLPLKRQLEKLGWKVFLPEIAGFGKKPPQKVWGLKEYSESILKEVGEYFKGKPFLLFGHSFGGRIAIKIASSNPKGVLGLILCATSGLSRPSLLKRVLFSTLSETGKKILPSQSIGSFKKLLYKFAREHDYENASGVMKAVFNKIINEDLKPTVKKVKAKTLIVWGRNDRMTPVADAYYLKEKIKNSHLVLFENDGHRLPYEKPEEVALEVDTWWK